MCKQCDNIKQNAVRKVDTSTDQSIAAPIALIAPKIAFSIFNDDDNEDTHAHRLQSLLQTTIAANLCSPNLRNPVCVYILFNALAWISLEMHNNNALRYPPHRHCLFTTFASLANECDQLIPRLSLDFRRFCGVYYFDLFHF